MNLKDWSYFSRKWLLGSNHPEVIFRFDVWKIMSPEGENPMLVFSFSFRAARFSEQSRESIPR